MRTKVFKSVFGQAWMGGFVIDTSIGTYHTRKTYAEAMAECGDYTWPPFKKAEGYCEDGVLVEASSEEVEEWLFQNSSATRHCNCRDTLMWVSSGAFERDCEKFLKEKGEK